MQHSLDASSRMHATTAGPNFSIDTVLLNASYSEFPLFKDL